MSSSDGDSDNVPQSSDEADSSGVETDYSDQQGNVVEPPEDSSSEESVSSNQSNNDAAEDDVSMGSAGVQDDGLAEDQDDGLAEDQDDGLAEDQDDGLAEDSQADSGSVNTEQNSEGSDSDQNLFSDESFDSDSSEGSGIGGDEEKLFEGSRVTLGEYMLAVLSFSTRHKLSGTCLSDLLSLVELICPQDNQCVKTLYMFKKYFAAIEEATVVYHHYCSGCESPLQDANDECEHCQQVPQKVNCFLELPVIPQIQAMLKRPGFYDLLQFRFQRTKGIEGNIEDVTDGEVYQEQIRNGFLANPNNMSFMWYTHGIALYKSSNFSVWPIFLVKNELKYKERTRRENIIFAGIWFGSTKPNPNVFLEPLNNEFDLLETEGHIFERADGPPICVHAKILLGTGDLQAKCRCLCFRQWNGYFGCLKCLIRGTRFFITDRSSIHVYPYSANVDLRLNKDVPDFAAQAIRNRQFDPDADVYGVKALSRLYFMLPNMISCMAIDAMHGLSGVMKTLINLWFDPVHVGEPYSLYQVVNVVDNRLISVKPPDFAQKIPHGIVDIAQWKCLDFKLFLLYYSLPILLGILPEHLWSHHCKLVSAMSTLLHESISSEQVDQTRDLLNSYVEDFEQLYGLRYMSINVHNLLHYPDGVRDLGPAWVYDCFFLEDLNGKIASLVHGTRHAALQISSSALSFLTLHCASFRSAVA